MGTYYVQPAIYMWKSRDTEVEDTIIRTPSTPERLYIQIC